MARVTGGDATQTDAMPFAGDFNVEDAFNEETEVFDSRKVRVPCPACGRVASPLLSPSLIVGESYWRWVGLDHQEPFTSYRATCPKCKTTYTFDTHVPQ